MLIKRENFAPPVDRLNMIFFFFLLLGSRAICGGFSKEIDCLSCGKPNSPKSVVDDDPCGIFPLMGDEIVDTLTIQATQEGDEGTPEIGFNHGIRTKNLIVREAGIDASRIPSLTRSLQTLQVISCIELENVGFCPEDASLSEIFPFNLLFLMQLDDVTELVVKFGDFRERFAEPLLSIIQSHMPRLEKLTVTSKRLALLSTNLAIIRPITLSLVNIALNGRLTMDSGSCAVTIIQNDLDELEAFSNALGILKRFFARSQCQGALVTSMNLKHIELAAFRHVSIIGRFFSIASRELRSFQYSPANYSKEDIEHLINWLPRATHLQSIDIAIADQVPAGMVQMLLYSIPRRCETVSIRIDTDSLPSVRIEHENLKKVSLGFKHVQSSIDLFECPQLAEVSLKSMQSTQLLIHERVHTLYLKCHGQLVNVSGAEGVKYLHATFSAPTDDLILNFRNLLELHLSAPNTQGSISIPNSLLRWAEIEGHSDARLYIPSSVEHLKIKGICQSNIHVLNVLKVLIVGPEHKVDRAELMVRFPNLIDHYVE